MIDKKISIIIPVYNAEQHLDQCIESVVNQTYSNLEIILINDGSTDSSLDICKKWHKKDSRILLVNKQNEGVSVARNKGLEIASGEMIGFVDSDDYIEPDMYSIMIGDMETYKADVVMCNSWTVTGDYKKKEGYIGYNDFSVSRKELTKRFINFEKIFCSSVWSKLYKKSIIDNMFFSKDIMLGEDYYFNGLTYMRASLFYYDSKPMYNYRIRKESISRNRIEGHFFDKYKVAKLLSDEYKKYDFLTDNDVNHILFGTSYEILYELYENKNSKELRKKWKAVFNQNSKKYKERNLKNKIKIFCMRYIPFIYVKITKKIISKG